MGGYFSNFIFSGGIRTQAELHKPGTSVQACTLLFATICSYVRSDLTDPGLVFSTFNLSFNVLSCSSENPCNFLLIASNSPSLYFDVGISTLEWLILPHEEHNVLIGSPRRSLKVALKRKQGGGTSTTLIGHDRSTLRLSPSLGHNDRCRALTLHLLMSFR